jgi:hypothetical protein
VRDFLQSWGGAIPTGEVVEELEAEGLSPNDGRLLALYDEWCTAMEEHSRCSREVSRIEAQLPWRLRRPFEQAERINRRFGLETEIELRHRANREREPLLREWGAEELEAQGSAAFERAGRCEEEMGQIVADTERGAQVQIAVLDHWRDIADDNEAFNGESGQQITFRVFEFVQRQQAAG